MGQTQLVHLINTVIIVLNLELQRNQAGICQVCAVNSRIGFCNDSFDPQVERNQGCMLPGRTLPIVLAADNDAAALPLTALGKLFVADTETEIGQIGNVGTVRKNLGAGRHDVVCGDVVADLENRFLFNAVQQGFRYGEGFDIGTALDFHGLHQCFRCRRDNHVVVDKKFFRQLYTYWFSEALGIGKISVNRGCGGGFGTDQIYLSVSGAAAALKVPVESPQGYAARVWRLSHTDTRAAGTFQHSCACSDNVSQGAVECEHIIDLLGAAADG